MRHTGYAPFAAVGLAMSLLLFSAPSAAQAPGGGGGAGGGGGTRGNPAPSPTPSPSPTTTPGRQTPDLGEPRQQPTFDLRRPVFLSGKVMMEDGTPPPESVIIERVCSGTPRPEAYTDSKGRFSFQLGQNRHIIPDASSSGGTDPLFSNTGMPGATGRTRSQNQNDPALTGAVSERDLMGCELRASLAGFRSDAVNLSGRRLYDNPDVGTIVLHRLANVEGTTISMTSLQAPKDAKKALEKGREVLKKGKVEEAQKHLEKAVAVYPQYAAAWFELGQCMEQQNKLEEARNAYGKSLEADAKFVSPYLGLAGIQLRERKWQDLADTTERIVRLNPAEFPGAYFFNAIAQYSMQNLDAAEKSARQAQKLDTRHQYPKIDHVLGVIMARKGDMKSAATFMRRYLDLVPNAPDAEAVKKQIADAERLAGLAPAQPQQ